MSSSPPSNNAAYKIARWLIPIAALLALSVWLYISPPGLLGKADAVGYAVCHRIDERSFHIGDRALPLCARCSGTFSAAAIGLLFQGLRGRRRGGSPPWSVIIPLGLWAAFFALDGANSYLYLIKQTYPDALTAIPNLYVPQNWLRLLTGTGMGLGMSAMLYPVYQATIWRAFDERPALAGPRDLVLLAVIALALDALTLTEHPLVLYPMALLSTLGVLALFVMVFSMVWILTMRGENTYMEWKELWLPLAAGLTLTLLFITVIDLGRLWMTGTWGGFPLG